MTTAFYPAIAYRHSAGVDIVFPDVPGCVASGDTEAEAAEAAIEALAGHAELEQDAGRRLPRPSSFNAHPVEPDEAFRVLVPLTANELALA